MKRFVNLLNGELSTAGDSFEVISPINQEIIGEGKQLSKEKIARVFDKCIYRDGQSISIKGIDQLGVYLEEKKKELAEQITLDTGYILRNAKEIVSAAIEFVTNFIQHINDTKEVLSESRFSYYNEIPRKLKLASKPYGIIAAMTPKNAPLILELTVIFNALAAGNTVILRPSSQCAGTMSLLIEGLVKTFPRELIANISIVFCNAADFLDVSYNRANFIHYIGSSRHGRRILYDSLSHNIKALVDGEGNSMVVIDETASLDQAIKACRDGIIRCNGELCSTVRTILVADKQFDKFCGGLVNELKGIKIDDPRVSGVDMGPLFRLEQAEALRNTAKKYSLISGEPEPHTQGKNYVTPLLCRLNAKDVGFLNEEVFGPITGVVSYESGEWRKWLTGTGYRLNDAVFSNNDNFIKEFISASLAPRIIINNDPSTESVFEPWGGFLPNGSDDVCFWRHKYLKFVQLDMKL